MGTTVGPKGGSVSEMNVVPLIDVLLVLLIIFMVINPSIPMGLHALIPQPAPPDRTQLSRSPQDTIVVQVFSDGKLKINQEDANWNGLGPRLDTIFKERAPSDRIAFVEGDDKVYFGEIAKAIDIMRASGVDKVGLTSGLSRR